MNKLKAFSFVFVLIFLLIVTGFVFAQRSLEVEYPEAGGLRPETTFFGLSEYVKYIFNLSIIIAGLIAFATFVLGGIRYMTSVGVPVFQKDARDQMFAAFIGLLVLLCSYMLLTTINPGLTLLTAPEITKNTPEFVQTTTLEKETLAFTEIPIGALIQELFLDVRLNNLKNFSKEIRDISKNLEKKAAELNSFVAKCSCSQVQPHCSGISKASCLAGYCTGNPCSDKDKNEIKTKRKEIDNLINDEEDGLIYWQKKLDREINGSTEEEDEYIGFRKVYEDLIKAEEMMGKCSATASASGKPQFLVAYKDFWLYQQYMAEKHKIEDFERTRPFEYIHLTGHPFYLTTFYCSEMLYAVAPIEVDEDLITEIGKEKEFIEEKTMCGGEILIGRDVDSSEELARRMLIELDNINDNAKKEILSGKEIVSLSDPTDCILSNCSPNCYWLEKQCSRSICLYRNEEGDCEEWGEEPYDCPECITHPCTGNTCPGDQPKKSQINHKYNEIKESNAQIVSSYVKLVDLIEERVDDDYLKISQIFKILRFVQDQITACHNPEESYLQLEGGREGVNWKEFFNCSSIKEFAVRETPFYDENGKVIANCYGTTSDEPDLMDNMFCCRSEYSPQ